MQSLNLVTGLRILVERGRGTNCVPPVSNAGSVGDDELGNDIGSGETNADTVGSSIFISLPCFCW